MSAPFFCQHRMGCSPHELDELLLDLAAQQQRMDIQAALAKRHLELLKEILPVGEALDGNEAQAQSRRSPLDDQRIAVNGQPNSAGSEALLPADWDLKRKMETRLRLSLSAGRDGQPAPDLAELKLNTLLPLMKSVSTPWASFFRSLLARFFKRRSS